MKKSLTKIKEGYQIFRKKYATGDQSVMQSLSYNGQRPEIMVVACCDSRVDPALILQCDPGDLFVVRNVANIIPPYEKDEAHHGTSAALEFGICFLQVKHLILLGHSQCGGIEALLNEPLAKDKNDFINNWVSIIHRPSEALASHDDYAKLALNQSYQNCLSFPWIREKLAKDALSIHRWFFHVETGEIFMYNDKKSSFMSLSEA